ncbi:hypothetical protein AVEN_222653-1 [Araneus ventricosus]|uniref:BTB domain-containing protein n=1 Tax=Araneus ventricosus TaxID=182803 RepID=A0A4Y2SDE8_ARAVE|nr:hypothetical protein AVEN_222653-1 [Araneus ventricosus]
MEQQNESGIVLDQAVTKEIKILNFHSYLKNNIFLFGNETVQLNKGYYPQSFKVRIFEHGRNCDIKIEIAKKYNYEPIDEYAHDEITWTFSIVDINGIGRFIQSFTGVNFINFPFEFEIPVFITYSKLLEQTEELIPNDILTVRCEVFSKSFPGTKLTTSNIGLHWDQIHLKYEPLEIDPYLVKTVPESEKHLIREMLNFLLNLNALKNKNIDLQAINILKEKLKRNKYDELLRTYMCGNPVFQAYRRLKRKIMEELKIHPGYVNLEEDLEPEFRTPWIHTKQQLKQRLDNMLDETEMMNVFYDLVQKLNPEKYDEEFNHVEEADITNFEGMLIYQFSKMDSYFNFFMHVVETELENDNEYMENWTERNNENRQTLIIETKDGVIFTLNETLVCELINESSFFKGMIEHTIHDINGTVILTECSQVFLQVLRFLQGEQILKDPFKLLCNAYEIADKYLIDRMSRLCADLMEPLLTDANIKFVQFFACKYGDEYLKEIVKSKKRNYGELNEKHSVYFS